MQYSFDNTKVEFFAPLALKRLITPLMRVLEGLTL